MLAQWGGSINYTAVIFSLTKACDKHQSRFELWTNLQIWSHKSYQPRCQPKKDGTI